MLQSISLQFQRRAFTTPPIKAVINRSSGVRSFQYTASRRLPRKDDQNRESLNPQPNEYSKSDSDSGSAELENAAFSSDKPRPEQQYKQADKEVSGTNKNNPLDVSPANKELSQPSQAEKQGVTGSKAEAGSGASGREGGSGGSRGNS